MSIIGSINKKNQEIRNKFNSMAGKDTPSEQMIAIPKTTTMDTIQEDEMLKNMVMELSIEDKDSSNEKNDEEYNSNLE